MLLFSALGLALGLTVGGAAWWSASIGLLLATLAWSWWCAPTDLRELTVRLFRNVSTEIQEVFR
jgi:hypothetical protein